MKNALLACLFGGLGLALLGVFVLARKEAFSGLAVSQLAALGSVAGILMGHTGAFGAALLLVVIGLLALNQLTKRNLLPSDAWIVCLYILGAAASVLILEKIPLGEGHTLNIFFGNILSLNAVEIGEAILISVGIIGVGIFWFHRWVWISSDPLVAQVSGIRVSVWNALFYVLLALVMTTAIHLFGVLLAFSYLLLPGSMALLFSKRLNSLFFLIPVITSVATVAGLGLSFVWDLPSGPFIAALLAAGLLFSGAFRIFFGKT